MRAGKWLMVALLGALFLPADAEAQRRSRVVYHRGDRCCGGNPWSFAPYAGLFKDALDVSEDDENTGWMLGFRVGYQIFDRARLLANVGYAESDDVAAGTLLEDRNVYDNQYIITTGGLEYDILPGNTSVSLGTELGGMWREVSFDHAIGTPLPDDPEEDGYTFNFVVVPALVVRHGFTSRTALEASVRDFIMTDDEVEHSPALTLGFRFR